MIWCHLDRVELKQTPKLVLNRDLFQKSLEGLVVVLKVMDITRITKVAIRVFLYSNRTAPRRIKIYEREIAPYANAVMFDLLLKLGTLLSKFFPSKVAKISKQSTSSTSVMVISYSLDCEH